MKYEREEAASYPEWFFVGIRGDGDTSWEDLRRLESRPDGGQSHYHYRDCFEGQGIAWQWSVREPPPPAGKLTGGS